MYYEKIILDIKLVSKDYLKIKVFKIENEEKDRIKTNNFDIEDVNRWIDDIILFKYKGNKDEIITLIKRDLLKVISSVTFVEESLLNDILINVLNTVENIYNFKYDRKILFVDEFAILYILSNLSLTNEINNILNSDIGNLITKENLVEIKNKILYFLKMYDVKLEPILTTVENKVFLTYKNIKDDDE